MTVTGWLTKRAQRLADATERRQRALAVLAAIALRGAARRRDSTLP